MSCYKPQLKVTVENFVLPDNSEFQDIGYGVCTLPSKCGGGGGFRLNGYVKSKRTFLIATNPVFFYITGNTKVRITLKKDGKVCGEKIIVNKDIVTNNVRVGTPYSVYCTDK
jgi:hypothetical protein